MTTFLEAKCKVINEWNGLIRGSVLKSARKISFLGDVDANTGIVVAKDSDIYGESIVGKILVFPGGRGSTVGAGVLFGLSKKKLAPKMIVTLEPDQVVVSGAIFGDIPMVSFVPLDFFDKISTGDIIEAERKNDDGILRLIKR